MRENKVFLPPCLSPLGYFTSCSTFFNPQQPFLRGENESEKSDASFSQKKRWVKKRNSIFPFLFLYLSKGQEWKEKCFFPPLPLIPHYIFLLFFSISTHPIHFPGKGTKGRRNNNRKTKITLRRSNYRVSPWKIIEPIHVYFLFSPISLACCTCDLWVLVFSKKWAFFPRFWRSFLEERGNGVEWGWCLHARISITHLLTCGVGLKEVCLSGIEFTIKKS